MDSNLWTHVQKSPLWQIHRMTNYFTITCKGGVRPRLRMV